ncbi:MAG: FAD:protein FMN transferase [Methylococcaceae bacterium]
MIIKKVFTLSVITLTVIILFISWYYQTLHHPIELSGQAQGTSYHFKLVINSRAIKQTDIEQAINISLAELDSSLSNYRDDSAIARINQQETSQWIYVSKEILNLLIIAQEVYQKSSGCYDLTVKPLFDIWGFSRHQNRIPSSKEIEAVLPHIGMALIEIDKNNLRIRKKDTQVKIDLSSIAQGYSVGVIAHLLEKMGITHYLVEIGGEMLVKGHKANGDNWHIAVQTPTPLTQTIQKIIEIKQEQGLAIMTAGTYQNFFELDGQSYSHIINPKTGQPINHHLRSVTVIHQDPTWADAWDTALLCMGEQAAMQIAEKEKLSVLLIYEENNQLKEYSSSAFKDYQ